ncbi:MULTISPECIES: extracellular solute-binding protein [unclassified Bradyrhizobium]|uniref:extracellular solute-binding protein n=1 Tax=unclassified Bradyrhizobium TaxID=2631580 RepID=UPI00247A9FA9|nr:MULTISPECIES: extracellular solute-binding protein [unclassified Bradyrhizobium]WGR75134.1 extracellular solute-binding protein [Bradyrhizobium sp. ISRA426]WGR82638.1 extracellular solute-binding protein [Bradyrhizobium sp. ISRA430]WGR90334.1 extracellular solute-binding protein [Bradyrhizobium sp. ISRA432]
MFMFPRLLEGLVEVLVGVLGARLRGLALLLAIMLPTAAARAEEAHAIAMHGKPALPADFTHMPYTNPDAPKGGRLTWDLLGTFDSLNPLIVKGLAVQQVRNYVIESLLARGNDEPFTLYGLLARTVETDDERTYVTFRLDPRARFSDGKPVLAEDVEFSWQLLRDHGRPNHRHYYAKVAKAEVLDPLTIRFDLAGANDRELPLILGLMPILPKHAVDVATFEETTMVGPIGSGPYRVTAVKPGTSVTLTRNPDYWGRDLPVNRGLYNFDEIRLDYYREANGQFEAFKRGLYDFRVENEPLRWHDGYDFPAAKTGEVIRDTIKPGVPQPSEFLVFNTRRPIFADIRVRQALTLLFDFELVNRNYFFGLYSRVAGYFAGSDLSAYARPADARERELLQPFAAQIPADIMDGSYRLPVTDGSGRDRTTLRAALKLLSEAGYDLNGTVLRNRKTKAPFTFEILVTTRDQERIALAFQRDLKRAGIEPTVRSVDPVQFDQRRLAFEFDMIQNRWDQSLSPGNEQYFYWGSAAADNPGTRNYMGAKDPAVDAMIAALLEAREHTAFVSAVRALDRTLIAGFYTIPLFNVSEQWIARWNRIERPSATALSGYLPETWWSKGQPQAK